VAIELIIAALATWRIVHAIQIEKIGQPIRKWFAGERESAPDSFMYRDDWLAYLIMCHKCLSFWVGIFCVIVLKIYAPFLYVFAISTIAIFIDKVYEHG
jgi:hypothetical protein